MLRYHWESLSSNSVIPHFTWFPTNRGGGLINLWLIRSVFHSYIYIEFIYIEFHPVILFSFLFGGGLVIIYWNSFINSWRLQASSKRPRLASKHRSRTWWLSACPPAGWILWNGFITLVSPRPRPPRGSTCGSWLCSPCRTLATSGLRQSSLSPCCLARVTRK